SDRYAVKNPIADAPTVTLSFANEEKVELVPAYRDNVGQDWNGVAHSPKGRAYWVPNGTGAWMLSDYDYDAAYISKATERSDGYLVPAIKMLKAIKRRQFPQLKSFALEILAADKIPLLVAYSKLQNFPITSPALLRDFFSLARQELANPIAISGSLSAPIRLS